jgi:hypothetical protein
MKLIIQPDEGAVPVIEFIRSARTSLILKQFTFTHPELLQAVVESHRAGVAVWGRPGERRDFRSLGASGRGRPVVESRFLCDP